MNRNGIGRSVILMLFCLHAGFGQEGKNLKAGCDKCAGNLLVVADTDCTLRVDGQDLGSVSKDSSKSIGIDIGDHLVMVTDGKVRWQRIVHVEKPGQVLVVTELKTVQEQKAADEKKAAEESRTNQARQAAINNWQGRWVGEYEYDGFEGRVTYHRKLTVEVDGNGACSATEGGSNDSRLGGGFSGTVTVAPIIIFCRMVDERRIDFPSHLFDMRLTYAGQAIATYTDPGDGREVRISMEQR